MNGHSDSHSPNSSHLSVHSEDALISSASRTHKQQTTQQVTTITKVIREVKHLGTSEGQQVDYVAMPLEGMSTDVPPLDYVAMPMGMYQPPRTQYMNYNHMESQQEQSQSSMHAHPQQHIYGGVSGPGGVILSDTQQPAQYHAHYQDYELYPSAGHYANSGGYGGNSSGVPISITGQQYLGEYSLNERSGTPPSPSENSGSPSPLNMNIIGQHHQGGVGVSGVVSSSSVSYLQTPYDDMPEYRITPSPGAPIDRYTDDPAAMVYGYVSTSPYVTGTINPTYDTRVVYDDDLNNGSGGVNTLNANVGVGGVASRSLYDDEDELQKHMNNLSLHNHPGGAVSGNANNSSTSHILTSPGSNSGNNSGLLISGSGHNNVSAHDDIEPRQMRWRDPNLTEVIGFLNNPNNIIKANAAAYLQHLCYMDDPNKQRTRTLGGIPPLVKLLSHENFDVFRNACGALRNLSYGRQNDENKRAIKMAGGIPALINLLRRSQESDIKELVTGVIWNMSSCEDLKRSIIDDGVSVIVTYIIIPHSGWDPINSGETCWSTVFRNASGVFRNVSSAGEYARIKLRECNGFIDSLLYVVKSAIEKSNIGNKIVENCVCILRNLSYRCQEVEDPNYDKNPLPIQQRSQQSLSNTVSGTGSNNNPSTTKNDSNLGCFGASKKKKESSSAASTTSSSALHTSGNASSGLNNMNDKDSSQMNGGNNPINSGVNRNSINSNRNNNDPIKGTELLWQPDVVQSYLALLQSCSNPETLEAAAGALQNLAACYWQPSIEIRAAVRKEKGLPILVELLRMEVDRVVCAVATALRNLAIDQRNKELIGKYAMRDLVQKLPSGNPQHDQGTSDDTIAAVLATLNEVIKKNAEFSRSLLDAGGVERLMNITRQRQKYTPRVLKFAGQVLFTMWQHQELRDVYKKHGWKEQDFVTKTIAARNAAPNSPNNANSTLNRPMASQGGTRYEDRTMKRNSGAGGNNSNSAPPTANNNRINLNNGGGGSGVSGPIYQRVRK